VRGACVIAAEVVRTEATDRTTGPRAARLTWAKSVYTDPSSVAQRMLWFRAGAKRSTDRSRYFQCFGMRRRCKRQ